MASIPSVDKSLGALSSWLSAAAFCGLVALAFLPPVSSPPAIKSKDTLTGSDRSAASKPPAAAVPAEKPGQTVAVEPPAAAAKAPPAATYPAAAPPEEWTTEELTAGLRRCLQVLAPAAMEIVMEEPMKRGQCGTPAPLALRSIGEAQKVEFTPAPTMNCNLAAKVAEWVEKVLQPAARQELGSRIKRVIGASSYSCRNIYNNPLARLSEHATGNAIDIAGFETADGQRILVLKGWGPTGRDIAAAKKKKADDAKAKASGKEKAKETPKGTDKSATPEGSEDASVGSIGKVAKAGASGARVHKADFKQAQAAGKAAAPGTVVASNSKEARFLKRVHDGSCDLFSTVLGPEANEAHRDHFHLDIKTRKSRGYCK
jgi:hypothetical protein